MSTRKVLLAAANEHECAWGGITLRIPNLVGPQGEKLEPLLPDRGLAMRVLIVTAAFPRLEKGKPPHLVRASYLEELKLLWDEEWGAE